MADLPIYHPIGPHKSLAEEVTDQIQQLILTGKFKEGEKLPSERELSESFGVSRTVVREAIRILQTKGLLQVRPGIGSIVMSPTPNQVIEGLSLLIQAKANGAEVSLVALCEVRSLLEIEIAKLAVERATPSDIADMQRILDELERLIKLPARFYAKAVDFHRSLALATHNPLLLIIFDAIQELVVGMRQALVPEPVAPEEALRAFREIVQHVQAGEPQPAARAIQGHLGEIRQRFEATLARAEDTEDNPVVARGARL